MNKKRVILFSILLLIIISAFIVNAAPRRPPQGRTNQFQSIIDLLEDMLGMFAAIFTIGLFRNPRAAFGFMMFLFWIMFLSIFYLGANKVFSGNPRQAGIIAFVLATMTTLLLIFQKAFMIRVLGNWLIWIYLLLVFGVIGVLVFITFTMTTNPWIRLLLLFLTLLMTLGVDKDLTSVVKFLDESIVIHTAVIGPFLYYYLKEVKNGSI